MHSDKPYVKSKPSDRGLEGSWRWLSNPFPDIIPNWSQRQFFHKKKKKIKTNSRNVPTGNSISLILVTYFIHLFNNQGDNITGQEHGLWSPRTGFL